jgi:hypothetical protein
MTRGILHCFSARSMESANPNSDTPRPCSGGCGFFGSAPLNYYCSVCFKKVHGEEEFKRRTCAPTKEPAGRICYCAFLAGKSSPPPTDLFFWVAVAPAKADEQASAPAAAAAAASPEQVEVERSAELQTESAAAAGSEAPAGSDEPKKTTPTRCFSCNKKVGLTGFTCRCGNTVSPVQHPPRVAQKPCNAPGRGCRALATSGGQRQTTVHHLRNLDTLEPCTCHAHVVCACPPPFPQLEDE